jgi:hypothetical protein
MALFFAFIAGVLVSATASRVGLPLWRGATALAGRGNPYVRTGALIASFALAAGILYLAIGFRHSLQRPGLGIRGAASVGGAADSGKGAATAKSIDAEVAGLEARLAREGGKPADWSLLAQAHDFVGRPEDAKRARAKAVVEARISRSGQATPAAGDLYVTSQVLRPAAGTRLALVINREIA